MQFSADNFVPPSHLYPTGMHSLKLQYSLKKLKYSLSGIIGSGSQHLILRFLVPKKGDKDLHCIVLRFLLAKFKGTLLCFD